ncbi:MAG TPA: signal peptidase II [Cyanobacteria bacterium UBA8530]|nr:signal peptidase II [Cyanobacteria bacterium UBA8530]
MPEKKSCYIALTCYLLALAILLLDQFTKFAVASTLELGQSTVVIDQLFYLTHVRNLGAAFSLFWGNSGILSIFSLAVVLGVIVYQWLKQPDDILIVLSMGFLMGGASGNLIDRFFFGFVRDMFDLRWAGNNIWPIFNVADMAVLAGVGLILLHSHFHPEEEKEAVI